MTCGGIPRTGNSRRYPAIGQSRNRPPGPSVGISASHPHGVTDLLLRAVAQRQDRERGGQLGHVLQERHVLVRPTAVRLLALPQLVEQLLPPVVLGPLRVLERVLAQRV